MVLLSVPEAILKPEGGESFAGYCRRIIQENPKMLKERSNDKLIERWMADHSGQEDRFACSIVSREI